MRKRFAVNQKYFAMHKKRQLHVKTSQIGTLSLFQKAIF